MKKLLLSLLKPVLMVFFFLAAHRVFGQEVMISIKISNQKKEPLAYASVTVISRTDSSQVFNRAADSSGIARFSLLKNSQYTVRITAVNYQPVEKGISTTGNQAVFSFSAEPLGKTLQTAVVTAQRPLMRQEDDKTIVEPENLVASSTSGYEVIEKTPGLFVDQDGNIYISSLNPATVQINGRDMRMSAADVATLLKSLPPGAIARIEIVRTPSAKYDAASSGGVVNVVLKKGVKIGMTGSVNAGMQQGQYGNQFLGLNLNNNDGKKSENLNLNVSRRNSFEQLITDRLFATDTVLSQDAWTKYPGSNYYGSYGISWDLNKKWALTYDATASYNRFDNFSTNDNIIRKLSTNERISSSLNEVGNNGSSLSLGTGVETRLKIDSMGSEWTSDTWFNHTLNKNTQDFSTLYSFPFPASFSGDGTADNRRNLITIKTDLKLKFSGQFTLEAGMQSHFHHFRNVTNYFRESGGVRNPDASRTNTFRYRENINAVYVQGSKTIGKDFVAKFGTRLENTNMKGRQFIPGDTSFSIQRTDLFPYVYLSKDLMKIAGFNLRAYLIYRRTIRRPFYDQLNPFSRYVDEFLTEVGNPSLRPQFTRNYEANISVDERPILAVGVNDTRDIFTNVIYQADSSETQAFRTYDNLGKNKEWYLRGLGAIPPGGRYFFVIGAQYNHNFYQGLYENKPLFFKRGTWTFFTYQTFKLDKRSVITLNGFYRLKGQQQFYELTAFGSLNASINRKFMKEKLVVTLSMTDMFYTNKNDFSIRQGSVNAWGTRRADTRRVGINIRYNFGLRKKEENNNMFNADPPAN